MKKNRKGFTLIELVVVTVIMGILASMGIPYYLKTVETSKAGDAVAIGHMLANSYRMYLIDNPDATQALSGSLTNACNSAVCAATFPPSPCRLVACNYAARQDWDASAYVFSVGGGFMAAARRRSGASPGTNTAAYTGWGYNFSDLTSGGSGCTSLGTTPTCPNF